MGTHGPGRNGVAAAGPPTQDNPEETQCSDDRRECEPPSDQSQSVEECQCPRRSPELPPLPVDLAIENQQLVLMIF